jgi:hypothetical protein
LEEWRYSGTRSSTSALDGGEWSASRTGRFTRRKELGLRVVLDAVVKRKIPSPYWESNPRTLILQPVVQHYTD